MLMNRITVFLICCVFVLVLSLLSGCRTTERFSHEVVNHQEDSTKVELQQQSSFSDSLYHSKLSEWFNEEFEQRIQQTIQTDLEKVNERITTTIDSLGNTIRVEERTTTRNTDTKTIQNEQKLMYQYQRSLDSLSHRVDSLQSVLGAFSNIVKADSISVESKKETTPYLSQIRISAVLLVIGLLVWFFIIRRR